MATPKPNATVCGVPTRLSHAIRYGGGNIYSGARNIGQYASISKPGAKRMMLALFGHARLPRPGYETKLCGDQYMENMNGLYHIVRRAPGDFQGARVASKRTRSRSK